MYYPAPFKPPPRPRSSQRSCRQTRACPGLGGNATKPYGGRLATASPSSPRGSLLEMLYAMAYRASADGRPLGRRHSYPEHWGYLSRRKLAPRRLRAELISSPLARNSPASASTLGPLPARRVSTSFRGSGQGPYEGGATRPTSQPSSRRGRVP